MSDDIDLSALRYEPLSAACPKGAFSCGDSDIDSWFLKRSHDQHDRLRCRVTTVHLGDNPAVVAFYSLRVTLEDETLLAPSNPIKFWATARVFPSLHLEWLAVHGPYQGKKIGTVIMGRVLETFRDAVLETGLPVLTLIPINDRVRAFYTRLGFDPYAAHKGRPNLMLPGQSVLDMYNKAKAQVAT